jgi:hypothetical protein
MSAPLRLVFHPTGDLLEASRECEADIFLHRYGNTRAQLAEEYGPYEQNSVFVALADEADHVLGTVRFLVPEAAGLKTLDDMARPPWSADSARSAAVAGIEPATSWDCATMGLRSDVPGSAIRLSLAIYHGLVLALRVNSVSTVLAILDERARRLLSSVGLILNPIPGTTAVPYLGSSASTPVFAHVATTLDHQRRIAPEAHRLVTLGIGLDGIVVPDPQTFRWPSQQPVTVPDGSRRVSAPVGHLG